MLNLKQHGEPGQDCLVFRLVDRQGVVHYSTTDLPALFDWLLTNKEHYVRLPAEGRAVTARLARPPAPRRRSR